jgi:thiol-disulfide isomerase/thioredoxin
MGTLDSIYVDAKFQNGKFDYQIYGNRIAENQFKRTNTSWDYTLYQIQEGINLENYQNLQKSLLEITEEKLQNLKAFRSKDNLTYRDDYKSIVEKEIIVDHLLYKEELTKKVKSVFPEKSILWEAGWDQIEQKVSLNDLQLLDYPKYLDYITIQILKKDTTEVEENIKLLNGFKKFPNGEFKNKIMYHKLMTSLEEANVSEDRDVLITYASEISSKKMQNSLQFLYRNLQKLSKLNPVPNIQATDQKGEPMQLSNLKGKWVIIDFWATWCGPCLYESPYFEKMALKYKNEKIAFLALSLDQRKDKWEIEAKNKSKTVLQWHANQINQTKFDYQINGIPRFVMIDPDGNIYQSKMSRPSEAAFEMILRKALGLKDLE